MLERPRDHLSGLLLFQRVSIVTQILLVPDEFRDSQSAVFAELAFVLLGTDLHRDYRRHGPAAHHEYRLGALAISSMRTDGPFVLHHRRGEASEKLLQVVALHAHDPWRRVARVGELGPLASSAARFHR
jgi:hypothetical protein